MPTLNDIIGNGNIKTVPVDNAQKLALANQAGVDAPTVSEHLGNLQPQAQVAAQPAPAATPAQPAAAAGVQQEPTKPRMSYADLYVALNPYKPLTPEQREAERKRNRRNAVFAALSDGISALSNLYFTTKGAPNAYNGGSSLSGKMYERQQQLLKDREAREREYLNGYIRALEMDRNKDYQDKNWKLQMENLAYNRSRQAAADKRAEAEHELNILLAQGKLTEQEYKNEVAKINARYAEPVKAAQVESQNALTGQRNASAAKSYTSVAGSGTGKTKFKRENLPGGGYADVPSNLVYDKSFWAGIAEEAGLNPYKGVGRKKEDLKDVYTIKLMVKNSIEGRKAFEEAVNKNGGTYYGTSARSEDPYAEHEMPSSPATANEKPDFDSMIIK